MLSSVVDFVREFYKLKLNACIYKPQLAAIRGPVTIKALPDIRTGTGEVVKNLKICGPGEKNILGATVLAKTVAPKIFFSPCPDNK